jgi:hypothetical protein
MDILVTNSGNIKYNTINILINKISISSISINPLKRIANFTVSYWNDTVFLGQESYTYNSTYTQLLLVQPKLKVISVSFTKSYTITINANITINSIAKRYTNKQITSPYSYLTSNNGSNLTIYYSSTDASIISLDSSSGYNSLTRVSYAYGGNDNGNDKLSVFYTVNDVQYNVNINQPSPSLLCHAGITTLYANSDYSDISLTTNSIYAIPLQIGGSNTLTVQSVPSTSLNAPNTQTNIYEGYDTRPFYKSVSALPTLTIYYNPAKISDISTTNTNPYTGNATGVTFTSATLITESPLFTYQFSNLSYTAINSIGTSVIVTFQNKQLKTNSSLDSDQLFCNPLDISDIAFRDLDNEANYGKLTKILNASLSKTDIVSLINTFKTINGNASINGTTITI